MNWLHVIKLSATSVVVAIGAVVLITGLFGVLIINEVIDVWSSKIAALLVASVAAFFVGMIVAKRVGHRKIIVSFIAVGVFALCLAIIKLTLFSGDEFSGSTNLILLVAASILAGLAASQKKTRR